MRGAAGALLLGAAALLTAGPAAPQDLSRMIRQAETDRVVFGFPAREGVCGAGDAILMRQPDGSTTFFSGRMSGTDWRRWREGDPPCGVGDVVVEGRRADGTLTDVRIAVGRPADVPGATILGLVGGQEAADYLLEAAAVAPEGDARHLVMAAAIAGDAVRWPGLLRLARDRDLPRRTRKTALHWLGREAAAEAARELGGIVRDRTEDDEVRASAVFALSQLPDDQAVDLLIEVVRTVADPRIRSRALFWLGEFDHPRAIALFEEILTRG